MIRILPEILSNQIAAGEVVQRPASVVKELVENSIDAGAGRITVEIGKGGKSLIRISDDGAGLSRDQALLAIERYATSKIFTKDDLFSISTFGFRGEALPSIASVAKFTLVTRTRDADIGTKIEISGGKLVRVSDAGAPAGTMVEVKHLFFNTPARRKFLKTDTTESGHIADAVSGMALGNPGVGFRLFFNQKLTRNFPAEQDLFQRAMLVLGRDVSGNLYPLAHQAGDISVSGACANPAVNRSTSNRIYLFVNNRLVYDRGLVAAVFQGYRGRIMKGRFPMGVVCVDLPFDQVDVNVHPSKREIKFLSPQPVYQAVSRGVGQALEAAQQNLGAYAGARPIPFAAVSEPEAAPYRESAAPVAPPAGQVPEPLSRPDNGTPAVRNRQDRKKPMDQPTIPWGNKPVETAFRPAPKSSEPTAPQPDDPSNDQPATQPAGVPDAVPVRREPASIPDGPAPERTPAPCVSEPAEKPIVLGQVMGTYIVAELAGQLMLVDQHAAHERVVYEGLKRRHRGMAVASQSLLVPETLELTHGEADFLSRMLDDLSDLGLRIEPFGGTTFVIKAIPALLAEKEVKGLVMELVETLMATGGSGARDGWLDACLISMACHHAIRANKSMGNREMDALLADLFRCENPLHCPHGRPTMVTFDRAQMEKLFKRVV